MSCLACGGAAEIKERRVLEVSSSEVLWKETILKVLEREGKQLDIDNLISQDQVFYNV